MGCAICGLGRGHPRQQSCGSAANYPQYELVIDNELAMQKGVSIKKAMDNLDILIGSTYEQGFIRFGNFFKVYTQAAPEFRRMPSDLLKLYVKNDRDEMVPYSAFMTMQQDAGAQRDHPLQPVQLVGHPRRAGQGVHQRRRHQGGEGGGGRDPAPRLRHRVGRASRSTRPRGATRPSTSSWSCSRSCTWCWPRSTRASSFRSR